MYSLGGPCGDNYLGHLTKKINWIELNSSLTEAAEEDVEEYWPVSSLGVVWCQLHSAQMVYFVSQRLIAVCSLRVIISASQGRSAWCPARIDLGTDPFSTVYIYNFIRPWAVCKRNSEKQNNLNTIRMHTSMHTHDHEVQKTNINYILW